MREVVGRYNTAKIFTDVVDEKAADQVKLLCDQEFVAGSKIRLMPDIHAGAGCTIGTTMTISDKIVPNLVGVDIGCGMEVVKLHENELDLQLLDKIIHEEVPCGRNIRSSYHEYSFLTALPSLRCLEHMDITRAKLSIGSLGGGNHFIEVDKDDEGRLYLVVHSGSRHIGLEVAKYYQDLAWKSLSFISGPSRSEIIADLKASGREKEIQGELAKLKNAERLCDIPRDLTYVSGQLFDDYIHDMEIIQEFADFNRKAIVDVIMRNMNIYSVERFSTIHNYIDTDTMILRKGAVSAKAGERLLIPINMRDGSLICTGLGNPDWNYSAPHGAGRLMSRAEAKKNFTVKEFGESMNGIYTTSVNSDTLDECPMAYKTMDDIVKNIGPTAKIEKIIKPIYNFKASE